MTKYFPPSSAGTSFPNTPESDLQPTVAHDVNMRLADGTTEVVRLHAADPGEAIDKIKSMSDQAYQALPRVAPK